MYGVSDADPFTFIAVAMFFLALGVAAAVVAARRAARVDPVVALRAERPLTYELSECTD
jgi:ABC-type antimicrobial peptide transport system permease subunit